MLLLKLAYSGFEKSCDKEACLILFNLTFPINVKQNKLWENIVKACNTTDVRTCDPQQ